MESTFAQSTMNLNINLNLVFLKSMNLNLKIKDKMNGSNPVCDQECTKVRLFVGFEFQTLFSREKNNKFMTDKFSLSAPKYDNTRKFNKNKETKVQIMSQVTCRT